MALSLHEQHLNGESTKGKVQVFGVLLCSTVATSSLAESADHWNTSDRLNRRTCPSTDCGVVGQLFYREKATVYEEADGWARITERYNANCTNGSSEFVDTGNSECVTENGIENGEFAEWVSLKFLSKDRPSDPADSASGDEELVSDSDDFRNHRVVFTEAAAGLIAEGTCSRDDFVSMGGWLKSSNEPNKPIYFTYCGNRQVYLDAESGETYEK